MTSWPHAGKYIKETPPEEAKVAAAVELSGGYGETMKTCRRYRRGQRSQIGQEMTQHDQGLSRQEPMVG